MTIKTKEEIKKLRQGGKILAKVLEELKRLAKPGVSTKELDERASRLIFDLDAKSSFKDYKPDFMSAPFPAVICTSINDEVVHFVPEPNKILKEGDILNIDLGIEYENLFTDAAVTIGIGKISKEAKKLREVTKKALDIGIKQIKPGAHLGDIGEAIQKYVEKNGFSIIRDLAGHGVGYSQHENPRWIYNFGKHGQGEILKEGNVLAIEPIVSTGSGEIQDIGDGFGLKTIDGSLAAHFEHTVVVTKSGSEILTKI